MIHIAYPFKFSRSLLTLVFLAFSASMACDNSQVSAATDTTERLQTSVARMNDWLGSGPKARTWRKYLQLNILDSQAAKGEQADATTLRSILARFEQGNDSLNHGVFIEVREAIRNHVEQIEQSQSGELVDIPFAVQQAYGKYSDPSKEQIEYQRDLTSYELQLFKKAYRRDYSSRERAEVFSKLKLAELFQVLSELEVELPPEVSPGKLRSMLADQQKLLEEVEDKIDALPAQPPEEDTESEEPEGIEIELDPPGPDSEDVDDLKSLEAQKKAINERRRELVKKFREALKQDRPRLLRRKDFGEKLQRAKLRFRALAKVRTDPAFVTAKQAVDRFVDAYIHGTEDNIQEQFLEQVNQLAELVPDLDNPEKRLSHARIGSILHWLESRQQLRDLCVAIRRRYSNPNAYVSVSSRMIQGLTTRTSSEYDRVAEDFLGRFTRGLSFTSTTVNVVPVDSPNQVHVSIQLSGTASTDTYIRERSFRIDSSASGSLSARRDLFANLNGLFALRATANANMSTQFEGINSSCGLVQRIARKSFAKEQGKANAESSRRAQQRLESRFVDETSKAIDEGVKQIEQAAERVRSFTAFLPQIFFRSFSQRVEAVAKKNTRRALSATNNPTFQTAGTDIQMKLHDSMLSNYLDLVLAGRKKMGPKEFIEEIRSFAPDANLFPDAADPSPEEDFRIDFPKIRPVQIEFSDNRIGITVTGTRFEQGEDVISKNISIRLKLKIANQNGKLLLTFDGTPTVSLAEGADPDAEAIAFAKILEDRLAEQIDELETKGFELPPNLLPPIPGMENSPIVQSLQLGLLEMRDGWLYIGWNWQGGAINTPAIWNEVVVNEFEPFYLPMEPQTEEGNDDSVLIVEPMPKVELAPSSQTHSVLDQVETGLGQ